MDEPHRCLHCELHDTIQRWIDAYGHPGSVEVVRCLSVVEWDVRQAPDWLEDGDAPIEGMDTHH